MRSFIQLVVSMVHIWVEFLVPNKTENLETSYQKGFTSTKLTKKNCSDLTLWLWFLVGFLVESGRVINSPWNDCELPTSANNERKIKSSEVNDNNILTHWVPTNVLLWSHATDINEIGLTDISHSMHCKWQNLDLRSWRPMQPFCLHEIRHPMVSHQTKVKNQNSTASSWNFKSLTWVPKKWKERKLARMQMVKSAFLPFGNNEWETFWVTTMAIWVQYLERSSPRIKWVMHMNVHFQQAMKLALQRPGQPYWCTSVCNPYGVHHFNTPSWTGRFRQHPKMSP